MREEGKRKIGKERDEGNGRERRRKEGGKKKGRKEEKENEMGKSKEMRKGLTSSVDAISLLNMFCIKSSFMDS